LPGESSLIPIFDFPNLDLVFVLGLVHAETGEVRVAADQVHFIFPICVFKEVKELSRAPKRQLRRKQRRRRKLRFLRRRLAETSEMEKRRKLIAKIRKISPQAPVPER
jgi:hypothetical protein